MVFIGREREINILMERFTSSKAEFLIIYGRRRIGKTELIKKLITTTHQGIILIGREESVKIQLDRYSKTLAEYFNDKLLEKQGFKDWDAFFEYIYLQAQQKRFILALDEFPYLIKNDRSLPSILQDYWDNKLKDSNIILIVLGSSISMMEKLISYKAPLYGRRTGQIKLKALPFKDVAGYIGEMERAVKLYSIFGGTPAYIIQIDPEYDIFENIDRNFLRVDSLLYRDIKFILTEELEEPRYYFSILEAIASGRTTLGEITNFTGLDRSLIGKYLNVLIDLGITKREIPVTASIKSKKGIYSFRDYVFNFWFRFIFPFEDLIELGRGDIVLQNIRKDLNVYLGRTFEDISKQFLWEINPGSKLPFPFLKLGSWWYKENEIDIVALDNESNILLLEVKWKELSISNAFGILEKLKIKSRHVKWHNENRIEHYGIIAKKIKSKKRLIDAGYYAFDLEDFNSACK
jgi:hypothetical protein